MKDDLYSWFLGCILFCLLLAGCQSPESEQARLTQQALLQNGAVQAPEPTSTLLTLPPAVTHTKSNCPPGGWTLFEEVASSWVEEIAVDPSGRIWAGFNGWGLSWMDIDQWQSIKRLTILDDVYVILPLESGEVWFGTQSGILSHFSHQDWEIIDPPVGDESWIVNTIGISPQAEIFVGASDGLYVIIAGDETSYSRFYPEPIEVYSLLWDKEGAMWVGAENGIHYYKEGVWGAFAPVGEYIRNVIDIEELPNGELWFTSSDGLYSFDGSVWERMVPGRLDSGKDPQEAWINSMTVDPDGRVWTVINSKEVQAYEEGSWKIISVPDIGPVPIIRDVEADPWGALWFATYKGVLCYLP